MSRLRNVVKVLLTREAGQALVEYGLILALVAIAAMAALTLMGGQVSGLYGVMQKLADAMNAALGG